MQNASWETQLVFFFFLKENVPALMVVKICLKIVLEPGGGDAFSVTGISVLVLSLQEQ